MTSSQKKHPWFKPRSYLHFDSPVSYRKAQSVVTSPKKVATHSFFPLIHFNIKSYKIYKDQNQVIQRKDKERPIAYSSHLDSHIYAYYAWKLSKLYEIKILEHELNNNVLAFRSLGKSNIEFANKAFEDIKQRKVCSVVALDVSGFFDNLDHEILKFSWANMLDEKSLPKDHFNVFKSLTQFSQVNKDDLYKLLGIASSNPKYKRFKVCEIQDFRNIVRKSGLILKNSNNYGIPQGSPISALLSNIYMLEFDKKAKETMEEQGGSYYRYCDDMLFITKNEFRNDIENFAQKEISKLRLSINTDKTEIRDFRLINGVQTCSAPLQYLGFTFDGQRKLIRSAALARFSNRMKRGVKLAKKTQRKRNEIKRKHGIPETPLYRNKLYERYSHLGSRNFITYGHRAADHMQSDSIRKQLKPLWGRLQDEMKDV